MSFTGNVWLANESTLLDDQAGYNIAWALNYQARYHFGRSGWRGDIRCYFNPSLKKGGRVPWGVAVLHLQDTSDVQGALGYHDEDGNEVPYGIVGVKTARDDGQQESEVASHELLELGADPNINLTALTGDLKRLYALEVGDPVQGTGYDVGAPEGRVTGLRVANFALPAYFDPNVKGLPVDFRGVLKQPFTIAPQGYMSFMDLTKPGSGWQQTVGAEVKVAPVDADDRVARRVQGATR